MEKTKSPSLLRSFDWLTIFIYLVLLALGWMSVCGACYDYEQTTNILDFSTRSGMQIVWIASSLVLGMLILMIDDRLIESLIHYIYMFPWLAVGYALPGSRHQGLAVLDKDRLLQHTACRVC